MFFIYVIAILITCVLFLVLKKEERLTLLNLFYL